MTAASELWTRGAIITPREFTANEIDLFRFSAVTWNAHRIHYDRAQAEADGLGGLPVQAHLHGAWLAQVARSVGGSSARLRSLSWANRAPVYAGDQVTVSGTFESVESREQSALVTLSLRETGPDGVSTAVEGSATVEVRERGER
jgi:hydroxyacyl-ACP dehydratase HTD2-like protein with hotdog domain